MQTPVRLAVYGRPSFHLCSSPRIIQRKSMKQCIYTVKASSGSDYFEILAGLSKPTSGSVCKRTFSNGEPSQVPVELSSEKVGIVFQFPERYFLTDKVLEEMLFGWPRHSSDLSSREQLALRLQAVIHAVGLSGIALDEDPLSLSGGYKRRLALAVQLIRMPDLLLLDEPLAGLDWQARADVVKLLKNLKKELTILVVSHDLKELAPVVDKSWKMEMGGTIKEAPLPN
ncbi:ABC transporter I family member 11 [Nymphaea thermarum]|nr:ABC transporter I family member 11 [Nymphaea thermarum]